VQENQEKSACKARAEGDLNDAALGVNLRNRDHVKQKEGLGNSAEDILGIGRKLEVNMRPMT